MTQNSDLTDQTAQIIRRTVAVAILQQDQNFLMQLRDDNPNILYPGHWAFFGGHLDPGETPEVGVRRELLEEIGYCPEVLALYDRVDDTHIIRYVYHGVLDVDVNTLVLGEGMDFALVTLNDIVRGDCYSPKINQVRPIGRPHQQILLNFIHQTH